MRHIQCLSGNMIKIIAAITMLIDHIGVVLYPHVTLFRIIGRISFPLFAFMLAEGARYTKSRVRHILLLGGLALLCQVVFYIVSGLLIMSILVTFTISLALIYLMEAAKRVLLSQNARCRDRILLPLSFLIATFAAWLFCYFFTVDYGFVGCMVPLILSLPNTRGIENAPPTLVRLDTPLARIPLVCLCILIAALEFGSLQLFSALSLPFLLLYSGKRGRWRMKYFFYVFYPLHLVLLYGIALFL